MSRHAETRDLMGPYVMDDLGPGEERDVEEHLQACPDCRYEAESLRHAHDRLADLADVVEAPPPGLKEQVVATMPRREGRRFGSWAAVAAAVLLLALAAAYVPGLLGDREVAAATLQPTGQAPEAGGEVEIRGGGENMEVHLEVWGLPPCNREEYFELWFVEGEERVSAGSFSVGESGEVEVNLNAPKFADEYPRVGITAEWDKNPGPSDLKMLGGKLREL